MQIELIHLARLNILVISLAFIYGWSGGSGGETTETTFSLIALAGVITSLLTGVLFYIKFAKWKSKWYLVLALVLLGILEAAIVDWHTILTSLVGLT
jgi:hypothetical protein